MNAWDPAELFPLEVFVEGIAISAAAVNGTLYSPDPDGQMLDTDAAKFRVEKIVWPSNETGDAWRSKPTSDGNGFELPEGWYIEKSRGSVSAGPPWTMCGHQEGPLPFLTGAWKTSRGCATSGGWRWPASFHLRDSGMSPGWRI